MVMRRRFARGRAAKPSRAWADVSAAWSHAAVAVTSAVRLMSMEMPSSLVNITSDPPEDLTILRLVGDFLVTMTGGNWTLGVIVQDHTWTPGATVSVDNDKRVLWSMTYVAPTTIAGFTSAQWLPPGNLVVEATIEHLVLAHRETVHIDISPKVKIEAGKALYLVAWENGDGGAFTTSSQTMRVLFQRSRRR